MKKEMMICPLLSIGKGEPAVCIGDSCAWWVEHCNYKGETIGGDCAVTTVADSMDNGLVCLVSGDS